MENYSDINNQSTIIGDSILFETGTIVNLTTNTISAIDSVNINVNANVTIPSNSFFNGNLHGNADTATNFTGPLSGDIIGTQSNTQIAAGVIVNADISASANIIDTKLATISTANKVANSATSATSSNTDTAIVLRNNTSGTSFVLLILAISL